MLGEGYTPALQEAFPDILPPIYPCGMFILCQIRTPKRAAGSILLPDQVRDGEKYRSQTAIVRAMGPAAYRHRETLEPWPEGQWCGPGDFVRTPLYGGDRVGVGLGNDGEEALFVTIRDSDIMGLILGNPLDLKAIL